MVFFTDNYNIDYIQLVMASPGPSLEEVMKDYVVISQGKDTLKVFVAGKPGTGKCVR